MSLAALLLQPSFGQPKVLCDHIVLLFHNTGDVRVVCSVKVLCHFCHMYLFAALCSPALKKNFSCCNLFFFFKIHAKILTKS